MKGSLEQNYPEFFLYYLNQSGIKSEDFRAKYKANQKVWQILELLQEQRKELMEPFYAKYFEVEKNSSRPTSKIP